MDKSSELKGAIFEHGLVVPHLLWSSSQQLGFSAQHNILGRIVFVENVPQTVSYTFLPKRLDEQFPRPGRIQNTGRAYRVGRYGSSRPVTLQVLEHTPSTVAAD